MFYYPGNDFDTAVAESRRKHVPLYFELKLWADTPSMYHEAGPMTMFLSAGELNKCRKLDMDPALTKRIGVGKVFRMPDKNGSSRYIFKLWRSNKRGYYADSHAHYEPGRTEHVFAVNEDNFIRWIVDDADNIRNEATA